MTLFTDEKEKKEFYHSIARRNISTGKPLLICIAFFEVFMILYSCLAGRTVIPLHRLYLGAYIFLLVCTLIVLAVIIADRRKRMSDRFILGLCTIYCMVIAAWSVFISVIDSSINYQLVVYMTVIMGISFALDLYPYAMPVIQLASCAALIIVPLSVDYMEFRFNGTINLLVFTIISVLIGIVNYRGRISNFRQTREIKSQSAELRSLNDRLGVMLRTDALTGAANRLSFADDYKTVSGECRSDGSLLSCAIIDVDDFKSVNDTYGHSEGDRSLVRLTNIMSSIKGLRFYRFGGEEFILLGKGIDSGEMKALLDSALTRYASVTVNGVRSITFSGGVYCAVPDENDTSDTVIRRADEALYVSKRAGKNRITVYQES